MKTEWDQYKEQADVVIEQSALSDQQIEKATKPGQTVAVRRQGQIALLGRLDGRSRAARHVGTLRKIASVCW